MDKAIYTVLRILLFDLQVEGWEKVFVVELINDQGVIAYAVLCDPNGDAPSVRAGERSEWPDTAACRLYDSLELAVKDYCKCVDMVFDMVWMPMLEALDESIIDELLDGNYNALIMNDITSIPAEQIYDVALDMYKQTVDKDDLIKRALDGLGTLKDDLSLSIHYLDSGDSEEAFKVLQIAMSYVGELSDDHNLNRLKKLRARRSRQSLSNATDQIMLYLMLGYLKPCRWSSDMPTDCAGVKMPCNVCIESDTAQAAFDHFNKECNMIPAAIKKVLGAD